MFTALGGARKPAFTNTSSNLTQATELNQPAKASSDGVIGRALEAAGIRFLDHSLPVNSLPLIDSKSTPLHKTLDPPRSILRKRVATPAAPSQKLRKSSSVNMEGGSNDDEHDQDYEFNAPKFHDFLGDDNDFDADNWFDAHEGSPAVFNTHVLQQNILEFDSPKLTPKKRSSTPKRRISSLPKFEVRNTSSNLLTSIHPQNEINQLPKVRKPNKNVVAVPNNFRVRSDKTPTIPKEFNFTRQKERKEELISSNIKLKPSGIEKRGLKKKTMGLTIPRSPKLNSKIKAVTKQIQKKIEINEDPLLPKSPFVSRAVKLKKFETDTPERFKIKPKVLEKFQQSVMLTQPKSPFLMTKTRIKNTHIPTSEEREILELEKVPKFKAQPIKMNSGPELPHVAPHSPTIPQSPAITKPRIKPTREPKPIAEFKANPIKEFPVFEPKHDQKFTIPDDVHLPGEGLSELKKIAFQEQIHREQENMKKLRKFKANPLPSDDPDVNQILQELPYVPPRPLTAIEPFNLHSEQRKDHAPKQDAKENQYVFKANPIPNDMPFQPKKSLKPPTICEDVVLASEIQAEKRKHFDEAIRQKEIQNKLLMEQQEREKEDHEREEVKKLRKELVHQAKPVKQFVPVVVQHSSKPLTQPETPL
ncbi:hypothetical protein HK096_002772, partial [Nowakowskiella sp. JEL0078]